MSRCRILRGGSERGCGGPRGDRNVGDGLRCVRDKHGQDMARDRLGSGDLADLTGTVMLGFADDQDIADKAGNSLTATTPTGDNEEYVVDNTRPTVTITGVPAISRAPFTATITFNEPVQEFFQTQIIADNATLSDFTETTSGTVWTVKVTPTADGDVTLDIDGGVDASVLSFDAAGNGNVAAEQARSTYDASTPTFVSAVRQVPQTELTNADSLTWRATFSEPVVNVDPADFDIVGTGETITVEPVAPGTATASAVWDVTATGGSIFQEGGISTVTLRLTANQDITDEAGNELPDALPTTVQVFRLDRTAPTVTITNVPPTSDGPFTATITFSEVVTGFVLGDVAESPNATLSDFTETTSGMVWTVLVTPTADGDVTLSIAAGVAMDAAGNGNTLSTPVISTYMAPVTPPPVIQDGDFWSATLTVADMGFYNFGCSNDVTSSPCSSSSRLTDDDFELGGVTYVVQEVTVGEFGNFYFGFRPALAAGIDADNLTITVDGQEVDVTLALPNRLSFRNRNPGFTWTAGQTVALRLFNADTTAPTVTITDVPAASDAPFTATLTFSEAVTGFTVNDITATNATLSAFTETTSGTVWTVLVTPTVAGLVTLDIAADGAIDSGGNGNTAADRATSTYTAPTPPLVTQDGDLWSATLTVGGGQGLLGCTGGDVFGNSCSDVVNLSDNDFVLVVNGVAETFRVNTISFDTSTGDFGIQIIPALPADLTSANLVVEAGARRFGVTRDDTVVSGRTMLRRANAALSWLEGDRVAMKLIRGTPPAADTTAPTVTSILRQDPSTASTDADALTWRVTFSEPVQNVDMADFAMFGMTAPITAVMAVAPGVASGKAVWDVTASGGNLTELDGNATLRFTGGQDIEDLAGNALTALSPTGVSQGYVVANPPQVSSITRFDPETSPTSADRLIWRVIFDEPVRNVSAGDFRVTGTTADLDVRELVLGDLPAGSAWVVGAEGGNLPELNARVTLEFDRDQNIVDEAGIALENTAPTGMNQGYVLDNVPRFVSIERFQPAAMTTDANVLTWRVRFSEPVEFVDTFDFVVSGTTAGVEDLSTANGTRLDDDWYVTAGGGDLADVDGTVTLDLATGMLIRDATGNRITDRTPLGTNDASYTVFNRPRVSSIVRQDPANSFTGEDALTWRVTFTEAVMGVDAADFAVDGTTATLAVAAVSGETGAWDVTASGGDLAGLNGEVTLRFAAGQNIQDLAGNGLTKTTPLVTNENAYRLSNTAAPDPTDPGVTPPPVVGPPTVTISGPSTVMEGTAATFTLTLNAAAPAEGLPVSVEVSEVEDTEQEGVVSSVVLASQTVTVAAGETQTTFEFTPEDDAVDADDRVLTARIFAATSDVPPVFEPVTYTVTIGSQTYTLTSSRPVDSDADTPIYFVGDPSTSTVTVTDDDERGVAIAPDSLTVVEGGATEYTVVLTSEPAREDVILTPQITSVTPPNVDHDLTIAPRRLTFTRDNWDEPQTVTVRAARDADAANDSVGIRYTADGGDYDGLTTEVVSVTVTETAVPQVTIAASATPVTEGFPVRFTLTRTGSFMDEALTVDVTLTAMGDAVAAGDEGAQTVTFTAGSATAELRVGTVGDDVDEPDSVLTATVVADTADPITYTAGSASSATVTVADDDATPRVTLSFVNTDPPGLAEISEGQTDGNSVALRARLSNPSSEDTQVTVTVPADAAAALAVTPDPPVLTIPAGATESDNTVTLMAIDDDVANAPSRLLEIGGTVTNAHGAGAVTIARLLLNDDDLPVSEVTVVAQEEEVVEGDVERVFFTLRRTGDLIAPIVVNLAVVFERGVLGDTTVEVQRVIEIGATENADIRVAIRDNDISGDGGAVRVMVMPDTEDPATYTVGTASEASVTVTDDDMRGVTLTPPALTISEASPEGFYDVVLTSEPTADVTITLSSDNADVTVSPAVLTFTPENWETLQQVTVTAVPDADTTDDTAMISHAVVGGDYEGFAAGGVAVTVSEVVLPVATLSGPSDAMEGDGLTFTLTLDAAAPAGGVAVDVTVSETGDVVAASDEGQRMMTVSAGAMQTTFTVSTVDDAVDEADSDVTVAIVSDATDPAAYQVGTQSSAMATVRDNDTRGVTLTPTVLTISEAAPEGFYDVVLTSEPTAGVTITLSSDNADVTVSPTELTFMPTQWNQPQTVTVMAVPDADTTDDTAMISHAVAGGDYNGFAAGGVAVTVSEAVLPVATLSGPSSAVTEGADLTFTLTLDTAAPAGGVAVDVRVSETGDVVAAEDEGAQMVTVPAGATQAEFTVATEDDDVDEAASEVTVAIDTDAAPAAYQVGAQSTATATVTDNDAPPPFVERDPPTVMSTVDAVGVSGVSVGEESLTLDFGENGLDPDAPLPNPEAFTVTVNGTGIPVLSVDFGSLVLTTGPLLPGQGMIAFDPSQTTNPLRRANGQEVGSFDVSFTVLPVAGSAMAAQRALEAYLPRFGRTVGDQVGAMISDRIAAMRSTAVGAREPGLEFVLGGQSLPRIPFAAETSRPISTAPAPRAAAADARQALDAVTHTLFGQHDGDDFGYDTSPDPADTPAGLQRAGTDAASETGSRTLTAEALLHGTRFMLTAPAGAHGGQLALWGRVSRGGFNGAQPGSRTMVDGDVTTGMLGMDYARDRLNFGAILSQSKGTGTARDANAAPSAIESHLTAFTPWMSFNATERIMTWASLGYGTGKMTLTQETRVPVTASIDWRMAAMGARGNLITRNTGFSLDLAADAMWMGTSLSDTSETSDTSDTGPSLATVSSDMIRARLGLAAAWRHDLVSGVTLMPRLEMGLRHDGGDAETGSGLEIGGGLAWTDSERGVSIDLTGRTLALHEDGDFEDWGLSASLNYDPHPETGQGFSMTMARSLGGSASGGVAALLGPETFPNATENGGNGAWSIEAAYGMNRKAGMVGSPYTRISGDGSVEAARLGYRIEPDAAHAAGINVDLWVEPPAADGEARARANLEWRW